MNNKVLAYIFLLIGGFLLGYGLANPDVVDEFNIYYMAAAVALICGALLYAGRGNPEANLARNFARMLVGGVFVVSGLIKANDTVGFGFKLEEYFTENALGAFWAMFHDFSWPIAFFVTGVEVILGFLVIFNVWPRLSSWVLLGMTLFFGWLTYFTASCNDAQMQAMAAGAEFNRLCVTDCGCFGDAMRGSVGRSLTPWESFYKDLALLFGVLVLVFRPGKRMEGQAEINPAVIAGSLIITLIMGGWLFGWMLPFWLSLLISACVFVLIRLGMPPRQEALWLVGLFVLVSYGFAGYTTRNLPVKDYRPYAEGKNIRDQMKSAEELGLKPTIYANVYTLTNKETGESQVMNSYDYMQQEFWKNEAWEISQTADNPVVVQRGYEPPIDGFEINDADGNALTDSLLDYKGNSLWVVLYNLDKTSPGNLDDLAELTSQALAAGVPVYGLSASPGEEVEKFRAENNLEFPVFAADEILLKTIIRSNPGLVLMRSGTVARKWHHSNLPQFDELKAKHLN